MFVRKNMVICVLNSKFKMFVLQPCSKHNHYSLFHQVNQSISTRTTLIGLYAQCVLRAVCTSALRE